MAIPQRADMVLERCTNAVASPFGVTGAYANDIFKGSTIKSFNMLMVILSFIVF